MAASGFPDYGMNAMDFSITKSLSGFETITLPEIEEMAHLNRIDRKFLFHERTLWEVLEQLQPAYVLLLTNHSGCTPYRTRYFDTRDYRFYFQHHNGRANRCKVRSREYLDTGERYLEVKRKTNKKRTVKHRKRINGPAGRLPATMLRWLDAQLEVPVEHLEAVLHVAFSRLTFVHPQAKERLTIDFNLRFSDGRHERTLPGLVVAEVKLEHFSNQTPFAQQMHAMGVRPCRLSKYCLGLSLLHPGMKANRFKPRYRHLQKLLDCKIDGLV